MQIKCLEYVGNGSAGHGITGVGFQPDIVFIKGPGTLWMLRLSTMATDSAKQLTGTLNFETGVITSLDSDGFTVGNNSRVNTNTTHYLALCIKIDGADSYVGTYTGTGAGQNITAVGFQPDLVVIIPQSTIGGGQYATSAYSGSVGTNGGSFVGLPSSRIPSFLSNGFSISSDNGVSQNTTTFHYLALKKATGYFNTFEYTGTGSSLGVTGAGFQPEFVYTQQDTTGNKDGNFRFSARSDSSNSFRVNGSFENAQEITSFDSDGFHAGTDNNVNTNGEKYNTLVFKAGNTAPPPTITITTTLVKAASNINVGQKEVVTLSPILEKIRASLITFPTSENEVWVESWIEQDP